MKQNYQLKTKQMNLLKQEYTITNPFNEKMAIEALQKQLSSIIFKELINNEKGAIKLIFLIEMDDNKRCPECGKRI